MTALLVVFIFIAFIAADYLIRRRAESIPVPASPPIGLNMSDFRLPRGVFFDGGHTWSVLEPRGDLRLGIDDFVQKLIGPVKEVKAPGIGQQVQKGDPLLTVVANGDQLTLKAPFTGRVTDINQSILENAGSLGKNPMSLEWIVSLEPAQLSAEIPQASIAEKTTDWLRGEIDRFKEFLTAQANQPQLAGATLPDGGEPAYGVLNLLDKEGWREFQKDFLN